MRRKKQEKLAESEFWSNFFYFNIPAHINKIPEHIDRVNFRRYHASDSDMGRMVKVVRSIGQLDLDETEISSDGIEQLVKMDNITEIRLKGCYNINNRAMAHICNLKGVELLHLKGTAVTTGGFERISNLKTLRTLLIGAAPDDPKLKEIFVSLPKGCVFIVNYKAYPFVED
jgi:hypothetical protein